MPSLRIHSNMGISCYSDPKVTIYEIRADGVLTTNCSVMLDASPISVCFDNSSCVWMCQADEVNHVVCFAWSQDSASVSIAVYEVF